MSPKDPNIIHTQLRIERDLWERATRMAKRQRMSTNAYVCNAVETVLRVDEKEAAADNGN